MIDHLTKEQFENKVPNFEKDPTIKFKGENPMIIDFYASWCGPCKTMAPMLEKLKEEYGDKLEIYKVDVEEEVDLANMFQIRGVPTFAFFAPEESCYVKVGAMSISSLKEVIIEKLKL